MKYKEEYEKINNRYSFLCGFVYALLDLMKESNDPKTCATTLEKEKQFKELIKG
jgi:hypothetical protein